MHERDLEPEQSLTGTFVDQVGPRVRELGKGRVEIGNLIGDVVHPGAAFGEEPADRGVLPERLEQLDAAVADAERGGAYTLILDGCTVLDLSAEQPSVGRKRRVQVLHRNTEMMNPSRLHEAMVLTHAGRERPTHGDAALRQGH